MEHWYKELQTKYEASDRNFLAYINHLRRPSCSLPDCCNRYLDDLSCVANNLSFPEFVERLEHLIATHKRGFREVSEFLSFFKENFDSICGFLPLCDCRNYTTQYKNFRKELEMNEREGISGINYLTFNHRNVNVYLFINDQVMIYPLSKCIENYKKRLKSQRPSENMRLFDMKAVENMQCIDCILPDQSDSYTFYHICFSAMYIQNEPLKHKLIFGVDPNTSKTWCGIMAEHDGVSYFFKPMEDCESRSQFVENFKDYSYFVFLCFLLRCQRGFDGDFLILAQLKHRFPGHEQRKELIEMATSMFKQGNAESQHKHIVQWVKELHDKQKTESNNIEEYKKQIDEKLKKLNFDEIVYTGIQDMVTKYDFMQSRKRSSMLARAVIESNVENAMHSLYDRICWVRLEKKCTQTKCLQETKRLILSKVKQLVINGDLGKAKGTLESFVTLVEEQNQGLF